MRNKRLKTQLICCLIGVLCLTGCSDYTAQREEVSKYNMEVSATTLDFKQKEVAEQYAEAIAGAVTYTTADVKLLAVLGKDTEGAGVQREQNETEAEWVYRSINHKIEGLDNDRVFNAYTDYLMQKEGAEGTDGAEGTERAEGAEGTDGAERADGEHPYIYDAPYIVRRGYYSTVSSRYLCQLLILYFPHTTEHILVRVYWDDNTIQKILIE